MINGDDPIIAYCRIGERSAHTWFVLHELLGERRREELRRLLDRVGQHGGRPDREGRLASRARAPGRYVARVSAAAAQPLQERLHDPRRRSPDHVAVHRVGGRPEGHAPAHRRFISCPRTRSSQRELQHPGHLGLLGGPAGAGRTIADEREYAVAGDEGAHGGSAPTSFTRRPRQADLLLGLAQGGVAQVLVGLVLAPARKRDLARVAAQVGAPLGEYRGERGRRRAAARARPRPCFPGASISAASSAVISRSRSESASSTGLLSAHDERSGVVGSHARNMWVAFRAVPSASAGHCLELDGVLAGITPAVPERSLPNSVLYRAEDDLIAALPALEAAYEAAGIQAWTVWVPEHHDRARRALAAAGHALDATPTAMIARLEEVESPRAGDAIPDPSPSLRDLGVINDLAYGTGDAFQRILGDVPEIPGSTTLARRTDARWPAW